MDLHSLSDISFKSRIIDMHTHTENWEGRHYTLNDLESLNNGLGEDKIEMFIISNTDCFEKQGTAPRKNELVGNNDLINDIKTKNNMRIMMVGDPQNGSVENLKQVYAENPDKIVGLKFHPKVSGLAADSPLYDSYLAFAEEKELPCLFHSQVGNSSTISDTSDPRLIYQLAKRHPKVPIILGHTGAGGAESHRVAIDTIIQSIDNGDANLYADISWMDWKNDLPEEGKPSVIRLIKEMKKRGKTDKILFGTDAPLGCFGEKPVNGITATGAYKKAIDSLKNAIKREFPEEWEQLTDDILYNNSKKLFFDRKPKPEIITKTPNKYLKPLIIGGAVVAAGAATALALKEKSRQSRRS